MPKICCLCRFWIWESGWSLFKLNLASILLNAIFKSIVNKKEFGKFLKVLLRKMGLIIEIMSAVGWFIVPVLYEFKKMINRFDDKRTPWYFNEFEIQKVRIVYCKINIMVDRRLNKIENSSCTIPNLTFRK